MENYGNNIFKSIIRKGLILSLVFVAVLSIGTVLSLNGNMRYLLGSLISFGPGTVAPADPNHYAYAENLGWIDFNPTGGNVQVTDSALTGYAWSENAGWISLNCANDNDNCLPSYKVLNDGSGNLSGYAYAENIGWINFDPMYGGTDYGVKIDSSGNFTGYAWGENAGWVSFNCSNSNSCANNGGYDYKVLTTWRYPYDQGTNDTATITINTQPSGIGSVDNVLTHQPAVLLKDSHGTNMADGTSVVVSLASGTGTLEGTKVATTTDGVATFINLGYSKPGEAFTILFTAGSATATSNSIGPLTAGALQSIVISPANSNMTVCQSETYTAKGFDQYSNDLGDITSATTFTVSGSTSGWKGTTYSNSTAGNYTITGTDGSIASTTSLTVTSANCGGGGGGLPQGALNPPVPTGGVNGGTSFAVSINNGAASTADRNVILNFTAGSNVVRMSVSNDPNFINAVQEPFTPTKLWMLAGGQGQKIVYVKFFTSYGVASNTISANINYNIASTEPSGIAGEIKNIANHVAVVEKQIAGIFGNQQPQISYPPIAESVPKETPEALQGLQILSVNPLGGLGLSPIQSTVGSFADKLPQLKKTLDALSINANNLNDIKKLSQTELYLPGLTQTISPENLQVNALAPVQAVPLAQLSAEALAKIPTNIVFANTGGGLIDFSPVLVVDYKGNAEQKITTISGKPMQLVIRPDNPTSRVTGLILFKNSQGPVGYSKNSQGSQNAFARLFSAALSVANPKPAPQSSESSGLLVQKFAYTETKTGIFTAEINAPATEGEYEITTIVEYKDQSLIPTETQLTVVVDPEGYVYQKIAGMQARISNATIFIYQLNPDTHSAGSGQAPKYELWPAEKFMQKNPVITDVTGKYSFLVPQGTYYLTATAPNYRDYKSDSFSIKENNGIVMDIELKPKNFLSHWLNWEVIITISLLIIIVLVCVLIVLIHKRSK